MAAAEVSSQKRSATSYARVLFETLTKMATAVSAGDNDSELSVIEALPDLYQCFLHQNRYNINFLCSCFLLKPGITILYVLDRKG